MQLSEEEMQGIWHGRTGLCVLVLMTIVSTGFCWFGWIGSPLDLTAPTRSQRLISRTGHSGAYPASPALWTASCVVTGTTFLSIPLLVGVFAFHKVRGPREPRGRSYRTPAILIMVFGIIMAPIGSFSSMY